MDKPILKIKVEYERNTAIELKQELAHDDVKWTSKETIEIDRKSRTLEYLRQPFSQIVYQTKVEDPKGIEEFFQKIDQDSDFEKRLEKKYLPKIREEENKKILITIDYEDQEKVIENDYKDKSLPANYYRFLINLRDLFLRYEGLDILDDFYYGLDRLKGEYINILEFKSGDEAFYCLSDDFTIRPGDRVLVDFAEDSTLERGTYISLKVSRQIYAHQEEIEDQEIMFEYIDRDIFSQLPENDWEAYFVSVL